MESDLPKRYFKLQRTGLAVLGISLIGGESILYRIYSAILLFIVVYTFPWVEFYEVFQYLDNLKVVSLILQYQVTHTLGIAKVSVILYYRTRIGTLLDSLELDVFAPSEKRGGGNFEVNWIRKCNYYTTVQMWFRKYAHHGKKYVIQSACKIVTRASEGDNFTHGLNDILVFLDKHFTRFGLRVTTKSTHKAQIVIQTLLYWGFSILVLGTGVVISILSRLQSDNYVDWKFPFLPFSAINTTHSPNFEIGIFYQSFCFYAYAYIICSSDLIITGVLAHISVQFIILQNVIKRIPLNAYERYMERTVVNKKLHRKLIQKTDIDSIDLSSIPYDDLQFTMRETVIYHLKIIGIAEQFEQVFNMLVLTVFLGSLLILCMLMYNISMLQIASAEFFQNASYVGVITWQVFMYCYWGNQVSLESQAVANACMKSNWVGTDLRFQKDLAKIIKRSQRPINLTAGKFTNLSLETYMKILKGSFSYYMVLRKSNADYIK